MVKHFLQASPIFSLAMTTFCLLAALFSMFHQLSGPFAIWMVASGVWFSLAVHAANLRPPSWQEKRGLPR